MRNSRLIKMLTPELAEVMAEAYRREQDPIAVIVSHAYFFSGLNINDLRNILTVSDAFGTLRTPSKELIRRMITSVRDHIREVAIERYGDRACDVIFSSFSDSERELNVGTYGDSGRYDILEETSESGDEE